MGGLTACQHVVGFRTVEPFGPDGLGGRQDLGLAAALLQAVGQQLACIFGNDLQGSPGIALDAQLEQFAKSQ